MHIPYTQYPYRVVDALEGLPKESLISNIFSNSYTTSYLKLELIKLISYLCLI